MPSEAIDRYPSRAGRPASVTPRTDPVVYADANREPPLARRTIANYENQGFLNLYTLFTDAEITAMQAELARLRHDALIMQRSEAIREQETGDLRSLFRVHQLSPLFAAVAADPRLVDLARYILDDEVYIHQSRLNYKPGFGGKEFYWHSDFETWHVEDGMPRMRALSVSISLTPNHAHNGPLLLIPGSHRRYVVCTGETPENHYQKSLVKQEIGVPSKRCLRQLAEQGGGLVAATGPAGTVTVFDCNTMHGSNGNITPDPRSNVFFVYNAMSNRLCEPYCGHPPRPGFIAARGEVEPVRPTPLRIG
ncbi:ectoine hydroxylase [Candidatus Macondimonas diazotrophica]|jgi:ectoine hydroxylase|uniref:Ectoine hydroxylase n=1 Tax=Candidatus Macondimonas diazotrophica TaxID=2305248 RepID=A0A4Z0F916_9GAMM|nr:ectoine hydroxylase [Candidatus Macondimonas diazotrophica]NCU00158.1 ectoine hydroxylase [Candidatus Macondimonas diazotrophica]TFZ81814.1 ectoine hydroxylase [Candidatus Macondimonas diazotrophica]HBG50253.1 ectoine hydroxylase [Gammaproteobacteria bacterium]